jgi:predicted transposase YbfD/YdcC
MTINNAKKSVLVTDGMIRHDQLRFGFL